MQNGKIKFKALGPDEVMTFANMVSLLVGTMASSSQIKQPIFAMRYLLMVKLYATLAKATVFKPRKPVTISLPAELCLAYWLSASTASFADDWAANVNRKLCDHIHQQIQ